VNTFEITIKLPENIFGQIQEIRVTKWKNLLKGWEWKFIFCFVFDSCCVWWSTYSSYFNIL